MAMTALQFQRPSAPKGLDRVPRRFRAGALLAACGLAACGLAAFAALPASAAETTVNSSYAISIAGIPIGRAKVETHFGGSTYSMNISGFTSGISRLVSDATASIASSGRISGNRVVAGNYSLDTQESGYSTSVRMRLAGGDITSLKAMPELSKREHRVPVTGRDRLNVVDPISAFLLPAENPRKPSGASACNRTLRIFDGWQRFDVKLSYRETKDVEGGEDGFSGQVFVCSARYVPVAGHIADAESVRYMADNANLEVWVAPVDGLPVLVPYNIIIGTKMGTLSIRATKVNVNGAGAIRKASVE